MPAVNLDLTDNVAESDIIDADLAACAQPAVTGIACSLAHVCS